jgi:hypothetical protein
MDPNRPTVTGQVVEVDILEEGAGFVLSIGPVSFWLGPAVAVDVLDTLARAVAAEQGHEPRRDAPIPRATFRRRIFS